MTQSQLDEIKKVSALVAAAQHHLDTLRTKGSLSQMYSDAALHRAAYAVFEFECLLDMAIDIENMIKREIGGVL
jgi:hypothetical protein